MKIFFTCNTIVDDLGLVASISRNREGKLYFTAVYQDLFQKSLQKASERLSREEAIEINLFNPRSYSLGAVEGMAEAKSVFIDQASKADMIFHNKTLFKDAMEFFSCPEALSDFAAYVDYAINDNPHLRVKSEAVVDSKRHYATQTSIDKALCARLCRENEIPTPAHYSLEEMRGVFERDELINYPLVFKDQHGRNGRGVFFIENREQLAIIFDEDRIAVAKGQYPDVDFDKLSFAFEEFIESPSEHYCKYRIVFNGFGAVHVDSVIEYSDFTKTDKVVFSSIPGDTKIYHDPASPLCLKSLQMQSTDQVVALYPLVNPKPMIERDRRVLSAHGINPSYPAVPEELLALAKKTAVVFSSHGWIGLQGQDWLQDARGRFYLIENNLTPSCLSFKVTRCAGKGRIMTKGLQVKAMAAADAVLQGLLAKKRGAC